MNLFDTNVITTAMTNKREGHERAKSVFAQSKAIGRACISTHNLAEIYNVLTGRMLIPPPQAKMLMERNLEGVEVISLNEQDYLNAIQRVSSLSIPGGVIYDAIIAECAIKRQCETLYTFNLKHFTRLGADITAIAREP
jgi:predicted nucleic acid-binding protein